MEKKVIARVRDKGEITIPSEIRKEMGIKNKDYLVVKVNNDGSFTLKKIEI